MDTATANEATKTSANPQVLNRFSRATDDPMIHGVPPSSGQYPSARKEVTFATNDGETLRPAVARRLTDEEDLDW